MRATGDCPPGGGGGPGSRSRSDIFNSPSTASMGGAVPNSSQQSQVPQPKRSQDVDELIHFVRNYQGLQRETTDLRLKRHALLPGIGRAGPEGLGGPPPGAADPGDRLGLGAPPGVNGYNNYHEDCDSDLEAELPSVQERRRTPSPPALWRSDPNPLSSASSTVSNPHSRYVSTPQNHTHDVYDKRSSVPHRLHNSQGRLPPGSHPGGTGSGGRKGRRITADVHQLPPIQLVDIPERPEAPAPGGGCGGGYGEVIHTHIRDRPKSAGIRRRRHPSMDEDSFTDRLASTMEDDDVDYIE